MGIGKLQFSVAELKQELKAEKGATCQTLDEKEYKILNVLW